MKNCEISIIVPVYNEELHLERLVKALSQQTVMGFETIFVNDGSTDGSRGLLDQYKQKYDWISVIHQENKGVSCSRNIGIQYASGTNLMFLDADDYLEPNAIESIQTVIHINNPDLIAFGMNYIDQAGNKNEAKISLAAETLIKKDVIHERIIPCMINIMDDKEASLFDFAANKVFKKEIIVNHNILFLETRRVWEDRPFVVEYLKYANNLYIIGECLYNYIFVSGSLSQRYNPQFFNIILENYTFYKKWFEEEYSFDTPYAYTYWSKSIDNMIERALSQTDDMERTISSIERVIHEDCVIQWFLNRPENSRRDKIVTALILKGNIEEVISFYQKENRTKETRQKFFAIRGKVRSRLKQLLGR